MMLKLYLHYKIMLKQTIEVLRQFEADKDAFLEQSDLKVIEKKPGSSSIKVIQKKGYVSGTLSPSVSKEKYEKIVQELIKQGIDYDLEIAMPAGGLFGNYGEVNNVFDDGKTLLTHKPGQVLLVDVWATWCPPCQQPMSHNQEMLQNNPLWKDKVRILGVSVDQDKEVIKKRVQQRKWDKITHLTFSGWDNNNPFIKEFKIQGIPFVCLVDKYGKINYIGHPNQINLQERINSLVKQGKEDESPKIQSSESPEEDIEAFVSSLTKERVEELFQNIELFCFRLVLNNTYEGGKLKSKGTINAFLIAQQENAVEKTHTFFGSHPGVNLKIDYVKYISVPNTQGAKCWECGAPLEYPFYWLKWEEGLRFGCRKCIEAPSHIEGHHFKYEKNSILLTGKWDKLASKNIGKNIQPAHPKDVEKPHQFLCNVCSSPSKEIGEARYICQGCRMDPNFEADYIDICPNCIDKVLKGDPAALTSFQGDGYDPNYPYLRILYGTHGYYDF